MTSGASAEDRADRSLEWALIANFVIHGVAMLGMAALLLPALPGGSTAADADRVAVIAAHPLRFRLGWLPWQLCAAADLWMAIAMARARWLPRAGSIPVLLLTAAAVIPDQYAQAVWVTRGVQLAETDAAAYLALERSIFPLTAGVAAILYTLAGYAWTYCFARAGAWSRALSILSVPLWIAMSAAVVSPVLPPAIRPAPTVVSTLNGLGFTLLQVWLALVTEEVLRRARPDERFGRLSRWRHPGASIFARAADVIANSRLAGAMLEPIPELTMRSDITDVVYVNYLIPAEDAAAMAPSGLSIQRLGPEGRYALFTFLTYRHGHFGFAFLGPLRRLLPSPVQTNWRVHVVDPETGRRGIYFLTNAVTHVVPALAARLTTEGMPMHVLARGEVRRDAGSGAVGVTLDPGDGTAPDAEVSLRPAAPPALTGAWAECFGSFRELLSYCVPQDRAMSSQPLRHRVSRQEIDLGIPIDACEPLEGEVRSRAARAIAGDAAPICFRVPAVSFRFSEEAHDRRAA